MIADPGSVLTPQMESTEAVQGTSFLSGALELDPEDPRAPLLRHYQDLCDATGSLVAAGDWVSARQKGEEFVRLARELFGEEDLETAIGVHNLAVVCARLGEPAAGRLYAEAAVICLKRPGPDHLRTVRYRADADAFRRSADGGRPVPTAAPAPSGGPSGFVAQALAALR